MLTSITTSSCCHHQWLAIPITPTTFLFTFRFSSSSSSNFNTTNNKHNISRTFPATVASVVLEEPMVLQQWGPFSQDFRRISSKVPAPVVAMITWLRWQPRQPPPI